MNTKEKIFQAALDLFSEKGFKATTIRDITGRTGITPGSFYNHFASKDELLQAVYDHYIRLALPPEGSSQNMPEYEQYLRQHGPMALFEQITRDYLNAMRNEQLAKLTKIILMEQYTSQTAGEIAYQDRQRLLSSMENLFVLLDSLGYLRVKDARLSGKILGYVYLGFASDNVYYAFLQKMDPDEIAAQQTRIITQYLSEMLVTP